jgi:hypothetical protein
MSDPLSNCGIPAEHTDELRAIIRDVLEAEAMINAKAQVIEDLRRRVNRLSSRAFEIAGKRSGIPHRHDGNLLAVRITATGLVFEVRGPDETAAPAATD